MKRKEDNLKITSNGRWYEFYQYDDLPKKYQRELYADYKNSTVNIVSDLFIKCRMGFIPLCEVMTAGTVYFPDTIHGIYNVSAFYSIGVETNDYGQYRIYHMYS